VRDSHAARDETHGLRRRRRKNLGAARPHTAPARAARRDDGARRDGDVERARDDAIDDRGRAARRDATREDAIGT